MSRYLTCNYTPVNPDKYVGTYPIVCRSSWEFTFCRKCDSHPAILQWASEPVRIPYVNPLTGKSTVYIPDFIIVYENSKRVQKTELIEIKPKKQSFVSLAKGQQDKLSLAINAMKWKAAQEWASAHGMTFRVLTEDDIYR